MRRRSAILGAFALVAGSFVVVASAGPAGAVDVGNAADFVTNFTDGNVGLITLTADIELTGEPGRPANADPLIIDGQGHVLSQGAVGRVFSADTAPVGALTLRNITITGGNGNSTGGGFRWDSDVTVENSTITGNAATNNGGGFLSTGITTITNSTITGNAAALTDGGGVRAFGASLMVTNSTISGNNAAQNGGAIGADGDVSITNSTISGNTAAQSGGGLVFGDTLTVADSTLSGNTATTGNGGAVNSGNGGAVVTITASTLSGNTAVIGGAVNIGGGSTTFTVTNSTVSGNTGTSFGGGINAGGGGSTFDVAYSTIAGNISPDGANIFFGGPVGATAFGTVVADPLGSDSCNDDQIVSSGYNYEAGSDTCNFTASTDVVNGADPQLGSLGSNGGPTATLLPASTSPLVDKIPAASPCAGVNIVVDQRGLPRPVTAGQYCDIGSVEIQALTSDRLSFTG
jgi:hypothetical protein